MKRPSCHSDDPDSSWFCGRRTAPLASEDQALDTLSRTLETQHLVLARGATAAESAAWRLKRPLIPPIHRFAAVIFASDFSKFPQNPESHYGGKRVRITGRIQEYQGKPEIILRSPGQIKMLAEQ